MYNLYYPQAQQQQLQESSQMSQTITTPSQTLVQSTTNTPITTNVQTPSPTTLPAIRQPTDLFSNPITPTQPPQKKQKKARFSFKNLCRKQISNQKITTHISRNLGVDIIEPNKRDDVFKIWIFSF